MYGDTYRRTQTAIVKDSTALVRTPQDGEEQVDGQLGGRDCIALQCRDVHHGNSKLSCRCPVDTLQARAELLYQFQSISCALPFGSSKSVDSSWGK